MKTGGRQNVWPTAILIISLVLNLALALALELLPVSGGKAPAVKSLPPDSEKPATFNLQPSTSGVTNRFCWQMIESTNYEKYVANLRGVGCPEKTVRAIVLAAVDRHYEKIKSEARTNLPFWTGGRKLQAALAAQQKRETALDTEESALVGHLLGVEHFGGSLFAEKFEEQAIARFLFGPMPDETFRRMTIVADKYEAIKKDFESRTGNLLTEEDKAEAKQLAGAEWQELKALLSPTQWEEFLARTSAFKDISPWVGANTFEVAGLSASETRQIALARASDQLAEPFDWQLDESDAERELRDLQFTNAVARILGETRFAEYERAQDGNFVQLFELARDNQLPRESAVKIYEMRQVAAEEVEHIRNDDSLDEPARKKSFAGIQTQLERAVSQTLGASAYQDYLQRGGNWITNVTKL